jgi:hypothetical protein
MKKSRILAEVNETARGLNRIDVLDQQTKGVEVLS